MKRLFVRMILTFLFVFLALTLIAAVMLQELAPGTITAIAFVISVFVGLLGPRPLEVLIKALKLEGQWAVLFTYAVAFGIGAAALLISKQIFDFEFVWDNVLTIAGILFAAATFAFHKLKDEKKLP